MDTKIALFAILVLSLFVFIAYVIYQKNIVRKTRDAKRKIIQLRENKTISEDFINFPKYYINLDRSEDRRKNMEKEIEEYGLKNIKRVSAFDGRKLKNRREGIIDGYEYKNISDKNCTKSEIAITMSHIKAIEQAKKDKQEYAMIMEDDNEMTLIPYWEKNINEMINLIPEECDILLLCLRRNGKNIKIISNKEKDNGLNGVNYIITKKGMEKIKKIFSNNIFDFNNIKDIRWDAGIMKNNLNIYHLNKSFFLPYNFNFTSSKDIPNDYYCRDSYEILKYYSNK